MRAAGLTRWARRINARASRSASAVTLQVFTTTTSASADSPSLSPALRRRLATASPSARAARHPKFSTWKDAATISVYCLIGQDARLQCLSKGTVRGGLSLHPPPLRLFALRTVPVPAREPTYPHPYPVGKLLTLNRLNRQYHT